ncbi:hypothetical protein [Natronorubrum halophilum]|uniref:hypothetical protein n=1 Tax=Natronorubrum halophilum TaxID=1702106 RepID=UPI000EF6BDAF|nr:hypothetical protein [Natronorubrum halophilum]
MAREPSVSNGDRCVGGEEQPTNHDGNSELLHRRSYMKLAGATTAATALWSTGAGASDGDYDVIEASGQVINIGNETFENKLVDVTNGNGITFVVNGAATIRNIGIKGLYQGDGFIFSITASSGTVEFENVYIGDGANKSGAGFVHGPGAIFYHTKAGADVVFRECNVQGYPNNGWYCSNSASGGSITWERCFGKNNGVTTFRAASGNDTLRECVAYNDDTDYSTDYGSWGNYSESSGRPLWVWQPGGCTVEDCHFDAGGYAAAVLTHQGASVALSGGAIAGGTQGNVDTSNAGSNPDLSIPDGVPTAAEAAASGNSTSESGSATTSSTDQPSNTIVFDGNGTADVTDYEFVVSDEVEASTDDGATIDAAATVDGTHARGTVVDHLDAWRFEGEIERLSLDGDATVRVNGTEVDPDEFDDLLEHVILFDGDDSDVTRYEFEIDGELEPSNYEGATIDDDVEIDGTLAHGVVADWKDAFRFSGDLEELTVDGPATVLVDGEEIDPADYGEELPHVLEIEGDGSPTSFEITVEGTIELDGDGAPEDEATMISGSTVQSSVTDGTQTFRFSGALTDVTLIDGEAEISLDGEEIDPADYGEHEVLPHALVIDGTEAEEPSAYSFEASGPVVESTCRDARIEEDDVIEGKTVRGVAGNWLDAYWFDGELAEFTIRGDAAVDVQYNVRDQ